MEEFHESESLAVSMHDCKKRRKVIFAELLHGENM